MAIADEAQMLCAVVIPALNPRPELLPLVVDLAAIGWPVVIVDDGSAADSEGLFTSMAAIVGVVVLHHSINMGKGGALKTGFIRMASEYTDCDAVVTVAADGRHRLEDIVTVVTAASQNPGKLVLGVRCGLGVMPLGFRVRKWMLELVFWLRTHHRLHDVQSSLRVLPRELMLEALTLSSNGYEFDVALLCRGTAWGGEILEVPIKTRYLDGRKQSRFRSWMDLLKLLQVLLGPVQMH